LRAQRRRRGQRLKSGKITLFLIRNDRPERFQESAEPSEYGIFTSNYLFYFIAETLDPGRRIFSSRRFRKEIGNDLGKVPAHVILHCR
jgi:hypothetical protein